MHITFAIAGATFGLKPSTKLCFLVCYFHIIVFTPLLNVFFLRCLFAILCFILYFAFSFLLLSIVYSCTKFDTHPPWCCSERRQRLVIRSPRLEQERDLRIPQAVTVVFR